jgi:hypothetical protein
VGTKRMEMKLISGVRWLGLAALLAPALRAGCAGWASLFYNPQQECASVGGAGRQHLSRGDVPQPDAPRG